MNGRQRREALQAAERILAQVAKRYRVAPDVIRSKQRWPEVIEVRRAFCSAGREAGIQISILAEVVGLHHATVVYHANEAYRASKNARRVRTARRDTARSQIMMILAAAQQENASAQV